MHSMGASRSLCQPMIHLDHVCKGDDSRLNLENQQEGLQQEEVTLLNFSLRVTKEWSAETKVHCTPDVIRHCAMRKATSMK